MERRRLNIALATHTDSFMLCLSLYLSLVCTHEHSLGISSTAGGVLCTELTTLQDVIIGHMAQTSSLLHI